MSGNIFVNGVEYEQVNPIEENADMTLSIKENGNVWNAKSYKKVKKFEEKTFEGGNYSIRVAERFIQLDKVNSADGITLFFHQTGSFRILEEAVRYARENWGNEVK